MPQTHAQWYLLCYSFSRCQKINDNIIQFFQCHVIPFHDESDAHSQEKLRQQYLDMIDALTKTGRILELFTEDDRQNMIEKNLAFQILSKKIYAASPAIFIKSYT